MSSIGHRNKHNGIEAMTKFEYEKAKEIAHNFQVKAYTKEDAITYMIENNMFTYRFMVEVATQMD